MEKVTCAMPNSLNTGLLFPSLPSTTVPMKNGNTTEKQILPRHLRNIVTGFPVLKDDIVVTSVGYHIPANDLWTGDSIWAYDCGGNFTMEVSSS
ncbi:MAG: hypothetical protein R2825_09280 [Saprospiraceae bacterium]